jgi:hypothetical protein
MPGQKFHLCQPAPVPIDGDLPFVFAIHYEQAFAAILMTLIRIGGKAFDKSLPGNPIAIVRRCL